MYAALDFTFAISDLGPHFSAWVLRVKLGHLAQQFAGALVARFGCGDGDFDDLVAALVGAQVEHALLAQSEALGVGGALRDLQQGTAVNGRHFDFRAQRRFPDRHRHGDFNIVAFAKEERVRFHFGSDVEIARGGAHGAGIALAGDAEAGTVARAWRNADPHEFGVGDAPLPAATGTSVAQLAGTAASRAGEVELHGAGHLADMSRTFALLAGGFAGAGGTGAAAGIADVVARNIDARLGALDGLPEVDIHDVLEVAALFGFGVGGFAASSEELRKDVAEAAGARPFRTAPAGRCPARSGRHIGEVEAAEIEVGTALPTTSRGSRSPGAGKTVFGVEPELVVHGTLLGVAQYVVGFLHVLEALLGGLVTRVEVGVVFAGELAIGLADFLRIGFAGYTQRFVVVVLGSRHRFQTCRLAPLNRGRKGQDGAWPQVAGWSSLLVTSCHFLSLLIIDIDEFGVDHVVLAFVFGLGLAIGGRLLRTGLAGALVHGFGQFVAGGGQAIDGGVDLIGIVLGEGFLGLFEGGIDLF